MKIGICGSVESNDCMITCTANSSDENKVIINSIVDDFFHEQIEKVIFDTLEEENVKGMIVKCDDKGALDFTIKSRLLTAIHRFNNKL